MKIYERTAADLSKLLQGKEITAVEVVKSFLERIETVDSFLKAFITVTPEQALETASEIDRRRMKGEVLHALAGVPIAIKDNICTEGIRTTCSSNILHNFIPPYDATVIRSIKAAGLPLLGKTNMDEFAMGSSTENSAFFTSRNPWDPERVPGGSSGGSAVAVSSGMAPLALGSDTGGSVRQPASFCGLVGLRPTYGRVSRYGLIAFASSLDQIGPLALTAEDSALLLGVIAGYDQFDSTSLPQEVPDYYNLLDLNIKDLKIGIIKENIADQFDPEVNAGVMRMVKMLEQSGVVIDEVSLPLTDYGLGAYYLIAPSEASSNLGRYDGVRYGHNAGGSYLDEMFSNTRGEGFGPEVKRRIIVGTYALSAGYYDAYYLQAMKVRTMIRRDYENAFSKFDLILGATTPTPAFRIGEKSDDPLQMYLSDVCNINDALAGIPSISIPAALHSSGLPLGMQVAAPPSKEALLFKVAHFLDQKREKDTLRPQINCTEGGSCQ
jgi:aspartyl-tRNA(Asn)/glutamyl-tRNA(Gln) amidotransferase subunit A